MTVMAPQWQLELIKVSVAAMLSRIVQARVCQAESGSVGTRSGFMLLKNLVIQRDAHALNETSTELGKAPVEKYHGFQEDRTKFLTKSIDEAKVRLSMRSLVLGKAKVMRTSMGHERSML